MMKINMYRKVTTLISFAAFILFWIIMCPLGMYGQESKWVDMNPVRKRYLRFHKDFAVDSVKYGNIKILLFLQILVLLFNSRRVGRFFTQTKVLYIKGNIMCRG